MEYLLRLARVTQRTASAIGRRSWRAHELLVVAGFDEARLTLEVPEGLLEADRRRVESLAGHS